MARTKTKKSSESPKVSAADQGSQSALPARVGAIAAGDTPLGNIPISLAQLEDVHWAGCPRL